MSRKLVQPPGAAVDTAQMQRAAEGRGALNLNPRELEDVTCDKCGNFTFQSVVLMKRVSGLQTPTGKEAFVPMEVFACAACGNVNDRFIQGMGGWFKSQAPDGRPVDQPVTPPVTPTAETTPPSPLVTPDGVQASSIPGLESAPTE